MKNILIIVLLISFLSCKQTKYTNSEVDSPLGFHTKHSADFDWLIGSWIRVNDEEGKSTYEQWNKESNIEYYGIGYTMQNTDTIWQENLNLKKVGHQWDLTVQSPGNQKAITFTGTRHYNISFACENQNHDFPKVISYWLDSDTLRAKVSNDEMEISFKFVKEDLSDQ